MAEAREGERVREDTSARWIGWIGIVAGIMAFFFAPLLFGGAAVVLGLITYLVKPILWDGGLQPLAL